MASKEMYQLDASSWYISLLIYTYDARSHLHQIPWQIDVAGNRNKTYLQTSPCKMSNVAVKQKYFRLLVFFFSRTIWLNRSS